MQTQLEGGFRGRTNKLVDACYSFWQGSAFAVLRLIELGQSDCADCMDCVVESEVSGDQRPETVSDMKADTQTDTQTQTDQVSKNESYEVAMNCEALQKYVIHCAQQPEGGLRGEDCSSK